MGFINKALAGIERAGRFDRFVGGVGRLFGGIESRAMSGYASVAGPTFGFIGANLLGPAVGTVMGGIYGGATSESMTATGTFKDVIAGAAVGAGVGMLGSKALWKGMGRAGKGLGSAIARPYRRQLANVAAVEPSVGVSKTYMDELREGLVKGTVRRSDFAMNASWKPIVRPDTPPSIREKAGAAYRAYAKPVGGMALGAGKLAVGTGAFVARHPLLSLALGGGTVGALSVAGAAGETVPVAEQERRLMEATKSSTSMESRAAFENSTIGLVQGLHRNRRSR